MVDIDGVQIMVGDGLEATGGQINSIAAQLMDELAALKTYLAPLAGTWVAQSSTFYQDAMTKWDAGATGLFGDTGHGGVLGAISNAVQANYVNYSDAEGANQRTWRY